jgi:hypothetical protein
MHEGDASSLTSWRSVQMRLLDPRRVKTGRRARVGEHQDVEEFGANRRRDISDGWRSAGGIVSPEDDLEMSARTSAMLAALARVGSRERLEFLG